MESEEHFNIKLMMIIKFVTDYIYKLVLRSCSYFIDHKSLISSLGKLFCDYCKWSKQLPEHTLWVHHQDRIVITVMDGKICHELNLEMNKKKRYLIRSTSNLKPRLVKKPIVALVFNSPPHILNKVIRIYIPVKKTIDV